MKIGPQDQLVKSGIIAQGPQMGGSRKVSEAYATRRIKELKGE